MWAGFRELSDCVEWEKFVNIFFPKKYKIIFYQAGEDLQVERVCALIVCCCKKGA